MAEETKPVPAAAPAPAPAAAPSAAPAPSKAGKADLAEALRDVLKPSKREKQAARVAEAEARGQNEVLKGLGVKKSERARMLEEIKAGRIELAEKKKEAVEAKAQVAAKAAEVDALKPYQERMKKYADAEFESLPEKYQKALAEMKIDDPMRRLDMIELWKRTGVIEAPAATKEATKPGATTTAPTAKPSSTLAAAAPPAASPLPTLNHYETWKQMKDSGQTFMAAQYLEAHQKKILEQRPK